MGRHRGLFDPTVFNLRAIDDPDGAARRDDVGRVQERPHHSLQSVCLDQRVGIHRANQLTAREAEPDVQSVGFAAVFFVDDYERRISRRPIKRADRFGFDLLLIDRFHRHEIEAVDQHLNGPILRSITYDNQLETRVVKCQQGTQTRLDRGLFVERGRQNGDGWRKGRA